MNLVYLIIIFLSKCYSSSWYKHMEISKRKNISFTDNKVQNLRYFDYKLTFFLAKNFIVLINIFYLDTICPDISALFFVYWSFVALIISYKTILILPMKYHYGPIRRVSVTCLLRKFKKGKRRGRRITEGPVLSDRIKTALI